MAEDKNEFPDLLKTENLKKIWDARYLVLGIASAVFSYMKFQNDKTIEMHDFKNEVQMRINTYDNKIERIGDRLDQMDVNLDDFAQRLDHEQQLKYKKK